MEVDNLLKFIIGPKEPNIQHYLQKMGLCIFTFTATFYMTKFTGGYSWIIDISFQLFQKFQELTWVISIPLGTMELA